MGLISKKWRIVTVIIIAVSAGSFVSEHFLGYNPVTSIVNTVATPIKSGFSYVADMFGDARDFLLDMRAYKSDNERLESEIIKLKKENRDIGEYKEENERLKALLELKDTTEFDTVAAKVISHSQTEWYREIEIDKGTISGIEKGDVLITPEGVVGRVVSVGPNFATARTILDKSSVMGVKVSRTQGTGLVEGDEEYAKNMQCKLSFVDRNTPVIVGDVIETSGSGGIYPAGLTVGTIISISADSTGALNFALIDPSVDFDALHEVLVIRAGE